jgi:hypothetical protein
MSFYVKIQVAYNNIIQAIRENPRVDTSNFLKDFKRAVINAIKVLPEDAKRAVRLKTIRMEQQLITLINDLRTQEPEDVVDDLKFYYYFTIDDGELHKLPFGTIKQTIDEGDKLPELRRHKMKPDSIAPHKFQEEEVLIHHQASPEADIQGLYDDFVGQINAGLASVDDIKLYSQDLADLYELIRSQIYPPDRPYILKKTKEMIKQMDDLASKLAKTPKGDFTISPIHLTDKSTGLYPEEKISGSQSIVHVPKSNRSKRAEDLPISKSDVVDFFEQISPSKQKFKKHEFPVEATLRPARKRQTKAQKVDKYMGEGPHSIYNMIGEIDDYKKKLQDQGLSKDEIRNRKDIREMNRVLEKKITYVEKTAPLLNEKPKKKSKKSAKDPTDVTKYTVSQLKDFMRQRKIKGLTGKKEQLLAIVQAYLNQDDEA